MKVNLILDELKNRRGQNIKAVWRRPMRTKKGVTNIIEKLSESTVRGGIDYENIMATRMKRETGEYPSENQGLPWGQWTVPYFIISHLGKDYLRIYPASLDIAAKVTYLMDGREVDKSEIEALCLASEFPKKEERPACFTVNVENLIAIGNISTENEKTLN